MNKQQEDRLWVLLAKQHSGEASAEEISELQGILDAEGISIEKQERLQAVWQAPLKNTQVDTPLTWQQLQQRLSSKRVTRKVTIRWVAAAAAIVIATTALFISNLFVQQREDAVLQHQAVDDSGVISSGDLLKTKTVLADGTVVWLHHDSQISFAPESFGKQDREITLTGEAFFEVTTNEELPFIVHAGAVVVQVKGTAFNVKAYPENATVETVLVSGSVEVYERHNPQKRVTLQPNEKIVVPALRQDGASWEYSISQLEKSSTQPLDETVWVANTLSFDNESLETLAPKLESWYNISIRFTDEDVKQLRFSAVIADETLHQTLDAMRLSYPFDYRMEKDILWIGQGNVNNEITK